MEKGFFVKEWEKLEYTPKNDDVKFFLEDWKKLGYKNPKVDLRKYKDRDICQLINNILRKYIDYKKVNEYPNYSESDKKLFNSFLEFFELDEFSWFYRGLPKELRGYPPILIKYNSNLMKKLRFQYLQLAIVLRKH